MSIEFAAKVSSLASATLSGALMFSVQSAQTPSSTVLSSDSLIPVGLAVAIGGVLWGFGVKVGAFITQSQEQIKELQRRVTELEEHEHEDRR